MDEKTLSRFSVLLGVLLIFLAIISLKVNASEIDNINLTFDKEFYSVMEGSSLKLGYTLTNNNTEDVQVIVYSECDEDELSCEYSKSFNVSANSSITASFYVSSLDNGTSDLKLYVKDVKTNEDNYFSINIFSQEDADDGEFEADISKSLFCKGTSNVGEITIDNHYVSDLYNISLNSNELITSLSSSHVYLNNNENKIKFTIEVPKTLDIEKNYNLNLVIENKDVFVSKIFKVNLKDCPIVTNDFIVTGENTTNFTLIKNTPITLNYTIKNISNSKKEIFVSSTDSDLDVMLSDLQVNLNPQESKDVNIIVNADDRIHSGSYAISLDFFDEKNTISKNLNFILQPKLNIIANVLQGDKVVLNIGHISKLLIVLDNKGDISDTIDISSSSSNDISIDYPNDSINLLAYSNTTIPISLSAGSQTVVKVSPIHIILDGRNTDFHKEFIIYVNAVRTAPSLKLDYLSFPSEVTVDANSNINFNLELYNMDSEDIVLTNITMSGLPQEITYSFPINSVIPANTSEIISGTLFVEDIKPQEIESRIIFRSSTGAVLSRPIKIIIPDNTKKDLEEKKDTKRNITGFFTLRNSILSGVIVTCLIIMSLFIFKVFKL